MQVWLCQIKKILEKMQKDIKTDEPERQKKEVDYIKKYNKKLKTSQRIQIVILIILLVYVSVVCMRLIILTSLVKRAEEVSANANNYHVKMYIHSNQPAETLVINKYRKDETYLESYEVYNNYMNRAFKQEYSKLTIYENGQEAIDLQEASNTTEKHASIHKNSMSEDRKLIGFSKTFLENLEYSMYKSIQTVNLNGKKCYFLKYDDSKIFFDIETGFAIKAIHEDGKTMDYEYEFGTVTDEDVAKPDLAGYKIHDMR